MYERALNVSITVLSYFILKKKKHVCDHQYLIHTERERERIIFKQPAEMTGLLL
jgi:hypothetical protein